MVYGLFEKSSTIDYIQTFLFYFIHFKIFVEAFVVFVLASGIVFYSITLLLTSLQFLLLTIKYNQNY